MVLDFFMMLLDFKVSGQGGLFVSKEGVEFQTMMRCFCYIHILVLLLLGSLHAKNILEGSQLLWPINNQ